MKGKGFSVPAVIVSWFCGAFILCNMAAAQCTTDVVIFIDQSRSMLSGPQGNRPIDLALNAIERAFPSDPDGSVAGKPRISIYTFRDEVHAEVVNFTGVTLRSLLYNIRVKADKFADTKNSGTNIINVANKIMNLGKDRDARTFFIIASDFVHAPGGARNGEMLWKYEFSNGGQGLTFRDYFKSHPKHSLLLLFSSVSDDDSATQHTVLNSLKTERSSMLLLTAAEENDIDRALVELRRPLRLTVNHASKAPDHLLISIDNDSCQREVKVESLLFLWPDAPEEDLAIISCNNTRVRKGESTSCNKLNKAQYFTADELYEAEKQSRVGWPAESKPLRGNLNIGSKGHSMKPKQGTVVAQANGVQISDEVQFTFSTWYKLISAQVYINAGVPMRVTPTVRGDIVAGKNAQPKVDFHLVVGRTKVCSTAKTISASSFKAMTDSFIDDVPFTVSKNKFDFCGRKPPAQVKLALQVDGEPEETLWLSQEKPSDHEPRLFVEPLLVHGLVFVGVLLPVVIFWRRLSLREFTEILEVGAAAALLTYEILDASGSLGRRMEFRLLTKIEPRVLGPLFFFLLGVLFLVCFWRGLFEDESTPRSLASLGRRLSLRLSIGLAVLVIFLIISTKFRSHYEPIGSCIYRADSDGGSPESRASGT